MTLEALGAFSPTWQSLEPPAKPDDLAVAKQREALSGIREELAAITGAEYVVVLAGLGSSMGITNSDKTRKPPRMSDLWDDVAKLPSFAAVEKQLTPGALADKNLEHALSDAQARLALDPSDAVLATFVEEAEAKIWESCSFVDSNSKVDSHELFLRKIARRSSRLQRAQIYTTNYDLALEMAAEHARFHVVDGFGFGGRVFDGSSFDLDYVRRRQHEPLALEPNVFHLLKLHGSVDWTAAGDEVLKTSGATKPANPVLIYPSSAKFQLSFQQPYLEFMSRFQIALRQQDVGLIVVGSGLNDAHLVAPLEAAIRSNIGLRAIFTTPAVRDGDRSATYSWIESLIEAGDRRLTLLNGTFDDLVRLLPDVPSREEFEAHSERVAKSK